MQRRQGIAIDIDPTGKTAVVVPTDQVDEAFISFIQSDEYIDWLEEAHDNDVDFPYLEPIAIEGKEYDLQILRVKRTERSKIGETLHFTDDDVIEQLRPKSMA